MISNTQTLKIKISVVRYPNFVMKIFSESSNDSLFDDVLSDFLAAYLQIFSSLKFRNSHSKLIKCRCDWIKTLNLSFFIDFTTQTLKIEIFAKAHTFLTMKIFSEGANVSLSDDITCGRQLLIESVQRSRKRDRSCL